MTGSLIASSILTTIIMIAVSPTTSDDEQNVLNRDILFDTVSTLRNTHSKQFVFMLRITFQLTDA